MEENNKIEEGSSLERAIEFSFINRTVPEIEKEIELKAGTFKGTQRFYCLQIYNEMENYLSQKLKRYGSSDEEGFDELARKLVFAGKSLICESTFRYIIGQAKMEGVTPQKYVDDALAIGKPQGIISSLIPDEKQVYTT